MEVKVRELAGGGFENDYGVPLMRKAFHPESGPLTNKDETIAERDALMQLFAGSIGRFKIHQVTGMSPSLVPKKQ